MSGSSRRPGPPRAERGSAGPERRGRRSRAGGRGPPRPPGAVPGGTERPGAGKGKGKAGRGDRGSRSGPPARCARRIPGRVAARSPPAPALTCRRKGAPPRTPAGASSASCSGCAAAPARPAASPCRPRRPPAHVGRSRRALRHAAVRQAGRGPAAVPASPRRRRGGCRASRRWLKRRPGKAGPRAGSRGRPRAGVWRRRWKRPAAGGYGCEPRRGGQTTGRGCSSRIALESHSAPKTRAATGSFGLAVGRFRRRHSGVAVVTAGGGRAGRRPHGPPPRSRRRPGPRSLCGARGQPQARFTLPGAFRRSPPAEGMLRALFS